PAFVERFRREAQAAANLSHPNIVPVFDWGEDDGTYFIVMELVDGTSLAEVLRGSRTLTASRSATIAAQVASALGYAHRSGVVHRDVKPGNILITSDGQVKVTDFGIAQAVSSEDHLAEEGSVMGTATYFSPEQASGESVDGRSDVYSLGVVLYEMLAGRPPFIGDSPLEVSTQHVHGSVPFPTQFNDTVPRDLEAIVMESLGKAPSQRYQSADEFRADLIRFTEGEPVRAAGLVGAFFGADATRAVSAVAGGERTQSVPMMSGPRTDVRRRRSGHAGVIATVIILLLALGGLTYFLLAKSHAVTSMPNVIGQPIATARQTLSSDGLVIAATAQVFSKQPSGTVVSTNPKPNAKITKGESVTLKVSLGKTVKPVTVP
ncbi:MAG TPA: protein kinase, partial [Acidimicrobiales bacterium]